MRNDGREIKEIMIASQRLVVYATGVFFYAGKLVGCLKSNVRADAARYVTDEAYPREDANCGTAVVLD